MICRKPTNFWKHRGSRSCYVKKISPRKVPAPAASREDLTRQRLPDENLGSKETRSHKTAWVKYTTNGDWIQNNTRYVYIYISNTSPKCSMGSIRIIWWSTMIAFKSLLRRKSRSEKWQSLQWRFICGLYLVGGFNPPNWKICSSTWESSPNSG